jgi:positive regulator of sigma E activity
MEFLPLIGILIAAFVAWKLFKGVIKLAVIGLLIAGAAWFFLGGLG